MPHNSVRFDIPWLQEDFNDMHVNEPNKVAAIPSDTHFDIIVEYIQPEDSNNKQIIKK
ncbi:MAG: hypothetical protein NVSMB46_02980 [Candidatus Saccharimonadales bacterium]